MRCLKYLKKGRNIQKRGDEGKQRFLKGGSQLGQGVGGALKRGTGTPLRIMTISMTLYDGL